MKIVLFATGLLDYTVALANALSPRSDVYFITATSSIGEYEGILDDHVQRIELDIPNFRSPRNLVTIQRISRLIRSLHPDILHIQGSNFWQSLMLSAITCPVVATIHDPWPHLGEKRAVVVQAEVSHILMRLFVKRFFVHGRAMQDYMVNRYRLAREQVPIIPLGAFSFDKKYATRKFAEEEGLVLFFGRLYPYKGLEYLIQAEPLITERFPKARFIIAGREGKGYLEECKKLIQHSDRFTIYHQKYISNELVAELFERASIVVLPYIDASQSGIVPLAYAFGKPVVVSDVGSLAEAVEDGQTGFVVPPRDVDRLAQAVVTLLTDKALRTIMGANGYRKTLNELSWSHIAEKTLCVYKELAH